MIRQESINASNEVSPRLRAPLVHRNGKPSAPESTTPETVDRDLLRSAIKRHLQTIGLGNLDTGQTLTKDAIRSIHRLHREAAQKRIHRALGDKVARFLEEIANGDEVEPGNIQPELIEVRSGSLTGDLFRFATLLWSIPVSQGYGRRLRYLVKDRVNGKLIGIFALGDPVFNLKVRDNWIGWSQSGRRERLVNVMDAYVVGALPPYADLLGGKLVASLVASTEVAQAFEKRYGNSAGIISGKRKQAKLALVTVTSALGRSSIYNRLRLPSKGQHQPETPVVELLRLGETTGYGHFQVSDELFSQLRQALREDGHKYAEGHQFGDGPNWRIRVVRAGLEAVGLSAEKVLRHGIRREVYAMPIASNARAYLADDDAELVFDRRPVEKIATLARDRWMLQRANRKPEYRRFRREQILEKLIR